MTLIVTGHRSLAELEEIINTGKRAFIEVGNALTEIRDRKLFKPAFNTFPEYCKAKWGFSGVYAYQLIGASGAIKQLPKVLSSEIKNCCQGRVLSAVPELQRQAVLHAAIETAQKECRPMTGRDISEQAEKLNPRSLDNDKPDDTEAATEWLDSVKLPPMTFRDFSQTLSGMIEQFEKEASDMDKRKLGRMLKAISQRLEA